MDENDQKKLKICLFGDVAAHHLRRWALYFSQKGHEVHIITVNNILVADYETAKIHIINKIITGGGLISRMINIIPAFFEVKNILSQIKPDVIHGQDLGGNSWLAALSGYHPLVVTPWGSDVLIYAQKDSISGFLTRFALKNSDIILCDGLNTKDAIVKMGIRDSKIKLFTFGVDIEKFKPLGLNDPSHKKTVISTRFLTEVHGVETLIRAIPAVIKEYRNVKFLIIGDGDKSDFLKKLSYDIGVIEFIEFAGRVTEKQIVERLRSADIYVSTSLSESGLAASTAEAMACELPIINTDTGDIRFWIEDAEGGFIIPVNNPGILAQKIVYLLKNDIERAAFGKKNRKIIKEKNNYYKEMDKVYDLYNDLMRKNEKRF